MVFSLEPTFITEDVDPTAWPSSYYGRTRRIDLAKLYRDTLIASQQQAGQEGACKRHSKPRRAVSFAAGPPTVHEYESEEQDETLHIRHSFLGSQPYLKLWDVSQKDLRPVPNEQYHKIPICGRQQDEQEAEENMEFDGGYEADERELLLNQHRLREPKQQHRRPSSPSGTATDIEPLQWIKPAQTRSSPARLMSLTLSRLKCPWTPTSKRRSTPLL
ncbi:hypothetical protein BCR43DRAFT_560938 [Syncephalastrum racemosum]|uniref:Uncharacterized protein n=1 Tax=Syncephalastrum racemosum TaxID=13706 RepID=A0A1X2HM83_SYNRA|nr:hypothetical protein BCR43DRAFT_560938 [Syncephalastrum racemosum]